MADRHRGLGGALGSWCVLLLIAVVARFRRDRDEIVYPRPPADGRSSGWLKTLVGTLVGVVAGALLTLLVFAPAEDKRSIAFQELHSVQTYLAVEACSTPADPETLEAAIGQYNMAQVAFRDGDFEQARELIADARPLALKACEPPNQQPPFRTQTDLCAPPLPGWSDVCEAGVLGEYLGIAPYGDPDQALLEKIRAIQHLSEQSLLKQIQATQEAAEQSLIEQLQVLSGEPLFEGFLFEALADQEFLDQLIEEALDSPGADTPIP